MLLSSGAQAISECDSVLQVPFISTVHLFLPPAFSLSHLLSLSLSLHFGMLLDPNEFDRIYEPLDVKSKKIHVVDSGLTYNLPYPLILRPQRGVDLIISFDFSARPGDSSPPFKVIISIRAHAIVNASNPHTE